jgi:hypothetical protein
LVRDAGCPHCGATVRSGGQVLGRTAGAVLMGLTLAGCPASDDTSDTLGSGDTSSTSATTLPTSSTTSTTDDSGSTTTFDPSTGPVGEAYGSPDTFDTLGTSSGGGSSSGGTDTDTDTDTDGTSSGGTDSGSSTGISPDYGVPTTGE